MHAWQRITKELLVVAPYSLPLFSWSSTQAYARGIRQPTHLLVTYMYTWYIDPDWWLNEGNHNCTASERSSVMEYALGPINSDWNLDEVAETGIVSIDVLYISNTICSAVFLNRSCDPHCSLKEMFSHTFAHSLPGYSVPG